MKFKFHFRNLNFFSESKSRTNERTNQWMNECYVWPFFDLIGLLQSSFANELTCWLKMDLKREKSFRKLLKLIHSFFFFFITSVVGSTNISSFVDLVLLLLLSLSLPMSNDIFNPESLIKAIISRFLVCTYNLVTEFMNDWSQNLDLDCVMIIKSS